MSDPSSDPSREASASAVPVGVAREHAGGRTFMDMNGYQWTVLFAAWLGWGFDVFDGLLFNFVVPGVGKLLLATGRLVFQITNEEPVPIVSVNPRVPKELGDVVMRCLRRRTDDRFASVAYSRELGHNEPTVTPDYGITATPLYLNNRASTIYAGSNEIQRNIVAKAVLAL